MASAVVVHLCIRNSKLNTSRPSRPPILDALFRRLVAACIDPLQVPSFTAPISERRIHQQNKRLYSVVVITSDSDFTDIPATPVRSRVRPSNFSFCASIDHSSRVFGGGVQIFSGGAGAALFHLPCSRGPPHRNAPALLVIGGGNGLEPREGSTVDHTQTEKKKL